MNQHMHKTEYRKMFEFENEYWWYRGLHELIEHYVNMWSGDHLIKIFDAGCGTGRMMEILARYGPVAGMDNSPMAVSQCRQRELKNVEIGNLNTWEADEVYDVLISNDVISQTGIDDDIVVLEKFLKALKPGGHLIMNLPAFECLRRSHDIAVFTKRRYRKGKLIQDLKKIGFRVLKVNYRLPLLFILILIKKLFSRAPAEENIATSDLKLLPAFFNRCLLAGIRIENQMVFMGVPFFCGSSLFVICQKKGIDI